MRNVVFVALLLCSYLPARAEVSMEHPVEVLDIHRSPPNLPCADPCNRTAVLFVHGFNGDRTTWQNGDVQWPELLADDPQIGSDLDVYRLDYFSTLTQGAAVPKLSKMIAERLDQKFFGDSAQPSPQTAYSKIVMVCHSLGGILCRNYLLHVKLRWGHQFLSLMRATITLGTPLNGSELANFLVLSSNEQRRVLRPQDVNDFLQLLNDSTAEFELKRNYLSCPRIVLYAGYEMQDTPLVEGVPIPFYRVVPQDSATLDVNTSYTKGFAMDHRQLAKPADRDAPQYKWVKNILQACKSETRDISPTTGEITECGERASYICGQPPWMLPGNR